MVNIKKNIKKKNQHKSNVYTLIQLGILLKFFNYQTLSLIENAPLNQH